MKTKRAADENADEIRPRGLRVMVHRDTGALTIVGRVAGQRIRKRAQSQQPQLAHDEAVILEATLLRSQWEREHSMSPADAFAGVLKATDPALRARRTAPSK
jgi:hypothetical protein